MQLGCTKPYRAQNVITTGNPVDYDWINIKFVVDTATKKVDIYVNNTLFCSPSVTNLTKEKMFNGYLQWWSGAKNQSVVYIDNFSISYIASHPDMVSEIKFLDETFPGFEQKGYEYDVDVYEDLYKDLSTENLDVVLNSRFDSKTKVTKTMEQIGSEKVITVTLDSSPWLCSYKFKCKSVMRPAVLAIDECSLNGYEISYKGRINNNLDEPIKKEFLYANGVQLGDSVNALKQSDKKAVEYITSADTQNSISKEYNMEIFNKMRVWSDKLENLSGKSDDVSKKIMQITTDMTESKKTEITKENVGKTVNGVLITAYLNQGNITRNDLCALLKEYNSDISLIDGLTLERTNTKSGKTFLNINGCGVDADNIKNITVPSSGQWTPYKISK